MKPYRFDRLALYIISGIICVSVFVFIGYTFEIQTLTSIKPGMTAMNPVTALCFLLCGIWLVIYIKYRRPTTPGWLLNFIAVMVLAINIAKLLQDAGVLHFQFDRLLFTNTISRIDKDNGIAPHTAVLFLLAGTLMLNSHSRSSWGPFINDILKLAGFIISYFGIIGFVYKIESTYSLGPFVTMAVNTTICFTALFLAFFLSLPRGNFSKVISSPLIGGRLARKAIPLLLLIPPLFGYLPLLGEKAGFYDFTYSIALETAFIVLMLFVFLYMYASQLNKQDLAEKELQIEKLGNEKKYHSLFSTMKEGALYFDSDGIIHFCNPAFCAITGYTEAELVDKNITEVLTGKEYEHFEMKRGISGFEYPAVGVREKGSPDLINIQPKQHELPFDIKQRHGVWKDGLMHITKNGNSVWANISVTPMLDDGGVHTGSLAMITDITERKYQEELLQKSEANLRTIFDHTDSAFVLIDVGLKIISFNTVAQKVMRGQNDTTLAEGGNLMDYFLPARQPFIKNVLDKVMNGETVYYEAALKQVDGSSKWYDVKWAGITNENEKMFGIILTSTETTEKKLVTLEYERITADLVQRNKDLQQFNYIVSHNLRAPVANILGLSALLTSGQIDAPGKQQLLEGLSASTKNLDDIIKDLNFILQVRGEGEHEKKETVYFHQLADDIKFSISNIITKEGVTVHCYFQDVDNLFTIRSYLYSIFYNLILNSIKYRQPGIAPVITIRSFKHKGTVELTFEDNGKGIDINRNGKALFGLYKRFDTMVEGKGIGLFMVKSQVENLGGKITVESKINRGTTFRIELPLQ